MPNALTKQAAASAVVSASSAPADRKQKVDERLGRAARSRYRNAWNVSHSLAKPLSGGRPEIAIAPTRKNSAVHGIRRSRPPNCSICRVPVAITTPPAPRNSSPLNTA